ncbi:MAG: hypothetical protein HC821_04280 [Lewinella sp.]|nr:hypothetical protein [Lewinella sp.]
MEVRGRYRRRSCELPPLTLHFNKEELKRRGYGRHNDFKLVTQCSNNPEGEDALLREYLAYQMYAALNPQAAYRSQLLRITYLNSANGSRQEGYAILLEDCDELQDRLNADNCKGAYNVSQDSLINASGVVLFEYMIGNTDFSFNLVRNLKLLRRSDGMYLAIPYDFDFSGLVNAKYAVPNVDYHQEKITDRIWVWEYPVAADLTAEREHYLAHKKGLLELVHNASYLAASSRQEIKTYLNGFFIDLKANKIPVFRGR